MIKELKFFVAQVNGNDNNSNLLEFLQQGFQMELSKDLLPWEDFPPAADLVTSPLLAIQINTFECGGIALGMQISHTVADAFSLLTFINEWASTCREARNGNGNGNGAEILSPIIMFHNFSSLFPARTHVHHHHLSLRRGAAAAKEEDASSATRIVLGNFLFEGSRISKVKEEIRANSGSLFLNPNPSRLVVVIALIWKALMYVSLSKHGQMRDSVLNLMMSLRGKAGVSSSMAEFFSFGNFWTPLSIPFEAKNKKVKKMEDLHHELVSLIENGIENARKKFVSARTDEIPYLLNYYREKAEKCGERRDVDVHIVSSWCRFPMYEGEFWLGKALWVSHATRKYEMICLMDAKDGVGIEAWISLEQKKMVEFRRNLHNIF